MQSVDGDVRLSVGLDLKNIKNDAKSIEKDLKDSLSATTANDLNQALQSVDSTIKNLITTISELQSTTANIQLPQTLSEDSNRTQSAITDAANAAERANSQIQESTEAVSQSLVDEEASAQRVQAAYEEFEQLFERIEAERAAEQATENQFTGRNIVGQTLAEIEALDRSEQTIGDTISNTSTIIQEQAFSWRELVPAIADVYDAIQSTGGVEGTFWNFINMLRNGADEIATEFPNAFSQVTSAASIVNSKIASFTKHIINSTKSLIQHAKASKNAKTGISDINSFIKSGLRLILKYGLGIRSTYALFNKLRSAVKEGYKNLAGYSSEVNNSVSSILSSLAKFKNQLAASFEPIISVVIPILNKLIAKLNDAVVYVGKFFAALTGKKTIYIAADVQKNYNDALDKTVKKADAARKALEKYLSPLDDINKFTEANTEDEDTTDYSTMFKTLPLDNTFTRLITNLKNKFFKLFEPIKESWNKYGNTTIESVKNAFNSILSLIDVIGNDFEKIWITNGEEKLGHIYEIIINITNAVSNLADNFRLAWLNNENGLRILQTISDIIDIILTHAENISLAISKWSTNIDFTNFLIAFNTLLTAISGLIDSVGEGVENFVADIILPLSEWTIEEGLPAALNVIAAFLNLVVAIGDKVGEILKFMWDNFFKNVAEWIGDKIVDFLNTLSKFFNDIADNDAAITFLISLGAALLTIAGTVKIIAAVPNPIGWVVLALIAVVGAIVAVITYWDKLKALWAVWSDNVTKTLQNVGEYWGTLIGKYLAVFYQKIRDFIGRIKTFIHAVINGDLKTAFSVVKQDFLEFLSGIKLIAKSAINVVIGWVNSLIRGIVDKINNVLSLLNTLQFDIPDWLGGGTLGFNVSLISAPQIPYLAKGAVIPPNRQFLAMLGDQKTGNNIETPENLLRQIVREETSNNNGGRYEIPLIVGNREITRLVIDNGKVIMRETGKNPFILEV